MISDEDEILAEILDILLMGPESREALATMLDETTERKILRSHPSIYSGICKATIDLEQANLIRKSTRFRDNWELTDRGASVARLNSPAENNSLEAD